MIARACGFKTDGISVTIFNPSKGGHSAGAVTFLNVDLSDTANVLNYLRGRVLSLYAGVLAQALGFGTGVIDHEKATQYLKEGGNTDHAKVRELVNMIRNIEHGAEENASTCNEQLAAIDLEMWNEASKLVAQEHKLIEGLGANLAQRVTHADVEYTLEEAAISELPSMKSRFPG